jgi:hypothetical protein
MKYILLVVLVLTMLSCFEQGDCSDISSNEMQLNFYSFSNKQSKKILIDSIIMVGWERDTVMYTNSDSLTKIKLPLDPATDTMTYHLYYQFRHDTLGISYDKKTFALAPGCNAIDVISLADFKSTGLQDFKISQPKLSSGTNEIENIKLFF